MGVGLLDTVGVRLGEGDGFGDAVGECDGGVTVGREDGEGEGLGDPVGSGVVSSWRMRASLAAAAAESSRCRSRWSGRRALLGRAMAKAIQNLAIDFHLIQSAFYVTLYDLSVTFGDVTSVSTFNF